MPENGVSTSKRCAPAKHAKHKCVDLEHGRQFKLGEKKNNEDDAASVIEQYQDVDSEPVHKSIVLSFRLVGERFRLSAASVSMPFTVHQGILMVQNEAILQLER